MCRSSTVQPHPYLEASVWMVTQWSWLLRNTFRMGMSGLPKRDDVFAKLRAPGSDDEALLLEQMRECSEQMNVTISLMRGLYLELDLEDVRKV